MENILQLRKCQRTHYFRDILVPGAHPTTHGIIADDLPYPVFPVPPPSFHQLTYFNRVKSISRLQCLKQRYLLTYYQK